MKICSLIIQNKKGQNLFVVSANDFPHETSLQYSKDIYNYILSQIKAAKKIHRSIPLDSRYVCVCTVTKEAIFLVIVQRQDLFLGYESIRKLSEFFAKHMKLEITTKKYQEMLLLLDEFLYTKELMPFKLQYNFIKPIIMSSRSIVDCDHLQRFSTLQAEIERNLIANIPLKYAKKRQISERINDIIIKYAKPIEMNNTQIEQDNKWIQNLKKFNYNCAFTLKSKTVQKENIYRKYLPQRQSLYQKNSNLKQPISKNQYMSISSSDIQIMKSKFQGQLQRATGFQDMYNQYSKKAPPQPQKQLNLLGQEEQFVQVLSPKVPVQSDIQPQPQQQQQQQQPQPQTQQLQQQQQQQQQQQSNITYNQSASQKIKNFNDLLDLDYQPVQQQQVSIVNPNFISTDLSFLSLSPIKQPEVHLKLLEKMILNQRDAKLKEIKIFGQIALEGEFSDDAASLQLVGDSWLESNGCQKRITPNSIDLQVINDSTYRMPIKAQIIKHPKGIIDYIIPTKRFSQNRLPLISIYKVDCQQNLCSFCLQYKVNENWKTPLFDVDIEVVLESDVEYEDLKTMPPANSISDRKILWKAKQLGIQQKGKLILNLLGVRRKEQQLLQYIRISLKSNTSIIEEMDCLMFYNVQEYHCVKRLSVEYKILPNT